jgi:hypothetical protein
VEYSDSISKSGRRIRNHVPRVSRTRVIVKRNAIEPEILAGIILVLSLRSTEPPPHGPETCNLTARLLHCGHLTTFYRGSQPITKGTTLRP